jgi:hypothetical protein
VPGVTVGVPISGAGLPSVCVMDSIGLVPNPDPVTSIDWSHGFAPWFVPSCHVLGETPF